MKVAFVFRFVYIVPVVVYFRKFNFNRRYITFLYNVNLINFSNSRIMDMLQTSVALVEILTAVNSNRVQIGVIIKHVMILLFYKCKGIFTQHGSDNIIIQVSNLPERL